MDIRNKKLSNDDFFAQRNEVLSQWKTGSEVNFEEAVEYQKSIAPEKRFGNELAKAVENRCTLIQPRAGVALHNEHIELLQYLEEEGEADLLPTTVDSYTRLNRYHEAETGIEKSRETHRSMLNGFPIVNYGVNICRIVTSALKKPVQVRHGTPDARLLTEISIAGGFTSYEGGGISYNVPYSKNHSIEAIHRPSGGAVRRGRRIYQPRAVRSAYGYAYSGLYIKLRCRYRGSACRRTGGKRHHRRLRAVR